MRIDTRVAPDHLRRWLGVILLMVILMVIIGGITRLTRSGLSIVEWRPITGIVPPLNDEEWETAFAAYRATPEYQKSNSHFDLGDFKNIFFWEYLHRLWGRLIGLAVFFPGLWLFARERIRSGAWDWPFARLWCLLLIGGGLQGLLGWYMVQSGLVNEPRVSHYRLAAHLAFALALDAFIFWRILRAGPDATRAGDRQGADVKAPRFALAAVAAFGVLLCVQILFGAFTAGLRAGYIHNTFPTMSGDWIPDGLWTLRPVAVNFLENIITIQFTHRLLGWLVFAAALALVVAFARRVSVRTTRALYLTGGAVVLQFFLGVATILGAVPIWLGVLHQGGALVLFNVWVYLLFSLKRN